MGLELVYGVVGALAGAIVTGIVSLWQIHLIRKGGADAQRLALLTATERWAQNVVKAQEQVRDEYEKRRLEREEEWKKVAESGVTDPDGLRRWLQQQISTPVSSSAPSPQPSQPTSPPSSNA